jgi:hypothetical protein
MDEANFSQEQIEEQIGDATKFIMELFDEKHLATPDTARVFDVEEADVNSDVNPLKRKATSPNGKSSKELLKDMVVDPMMKGFYERMAQRSLRAQAVNTEKSVEQVNRERYKAEIIELIKKDVEKYIRHCQGPRFIKNALAVYGNEKYRNPNSTFDGNRVADIMMDGHYAHKFFDVTRWWSEEGHRLFYYVSKAASVFIGKPSHNGFQERVFSRGTYFDSALKQRLKEENFEKAVLNSLTQTKVLEYKKAMNWEEVEIKDEEVQLEVDNFYRKEDTGRSDIFQPSDLVNLFDTRDDGDGEQSVIAEGCIWSQESDDGDTSDEDMTM